MKLTLYQIDAFTKNLFSGNPAAVIPLQDWLDDKLMQQIAMENNLSETVYFVPVGGNSSPEGGNQAERRLGTKFGDGADYDIRWFTPELEINLCGHATLASAFVYNYLGFKKKKIVFHSKSGKLEVEKMGDVIRMDFPSWPPRRIQEYHPDLQKALRVKEIVGVYKHRDLLVELQNENAVKKCNPDFTLLKEIGEKIIITAPGSAEIDFVSRFFAPVAGINEDPVTGSSHSQLIPFWSEKLNKKKMFAKQVSARGGDLQCGMWGDRVTMAGQCVFYMKGEITIDNEQ
jgi:PhzF family phenazine biosynthesis protein